MDDLYREQILEHYKRPHHFGELDESDLEFFDSNPLCGDELRVQLKLDPGGRVEEVAEFDRHLRGLFGIAHPVRFPAAARHHREAGCVVLTRPPQRRQSSAYENVHWTTSSLAPPALR